MWLVFWADHLFPLAHFYQYGVHPGDPNSLIGIITMPFIHSKNGYEHIVNNSIPIAILAGALVYYYRSIAFRVFMISWIATGAGVWLFATDTNSYHIGMSGLIYAFAAFLFVSGLFRKYLPLQAISLFVTFVYGSLIWGIFPTSSHISWEGHLSGLVTGTILAIVYRKLGPQRPKYQYEIEKDLGIEPPDLEGQWRERVRLERERIAQIEAMQRALQEEASNETPREQPKIIYHFKPRNPKPPDDTTPQ